MKNTLFTLSAIAVALLSFEATLQAQDCASCNDGGSARTARFAGGGLLGRLNPLGPRHTGPGATGADGMTQPTYMAFPLSPPHALKLAATDHFSPNPLYAYSQHGVESQWTHQWNRQQMDVHPWHGGYNSWRFGTPTALVVPPTAAFQTNYRWGVGQTTSTPIYHQFGSGNCMSGGGGEGMFSNTPYWPSSTDQFGYYPVRAPWGGQ